MTVFCKHILCKVLMTYNFTAEWRKGSQNDTSDALSCISTLSKTLMSLVIEGDDFHFH